MKTTDPLVILLAIIVAPCYNGVGAQFPVACVQNATRPGAVCCPAPSGLDAPCGGPERGACVALTAAAADDAPTEELRDDDRLNWPLRFFAFGCRCRPAYWGADCGEALATAARRRRLRKNALNLSLEESQLLRRVLVASKTHPSGWAVLNITGSENGDPATPEKLAFANASVYDLLVYLHLYASRSTLLQPRMPDGDDETGDGCPSSRHQLNFAHRGPAFLPWHRHYLSLAESMFARVAWQRFGAAEFALPYWDWVGGAACDVCLPELVGGVGNATADDDPSNGQVGGDFAEWRSFCQRRSGQGSCHVCDPTAAAAAGSGEPLWRVYNPELADAGLPDAAETAFLLLNVSQYDAPPYNQSATDGFRNLLEGFVNSSGQLSADTGRPYMHNLVHSYMRGTWLDVSLSPNDPLFWLHHCFVDKLFEIWLRSAQSSDPASHLPETGVPVGHSRLSNMVPFFPPVTVAAAFAKSEALGYGYDTLRLASGMDALALRGVQATSGGAGLASDTGGRNLLAGWNFQLLSLVEFLALLVCGCVLAGCACLGLSRCVTRSRRGPYRQVEGHGEGDKGDQRPFENSGEETPLLADKKAARMQKAGAAASADDAPPSYV